MSNWKKAGRKVSSEGTTVIYELEGTDITIESRKRLIPHANGSGGWWHTTYWVLKAGRDKIERYSLADAKEWAEKELENDG